MTTTRSDARRRARVPLALALLAAAAALTGCGSTFTGMTKELREHGAPAQATILQVWDTGWTVNDDPVIGMRVRVQPAGQPSFEATIAKTLVSRIDVPQFQPGSVVPVRFDPKNHASVAVDFEGAQAAAVGSGNPYRDNFVRAPAGTAFLPPPAELAVYLGTGDSAADEIAMVENGYATIGASPVAAGASLLQAVEQGKTVGAAVVVLYGHFETPSGAPLSPLPFHARPGSAGAPAGGSIVPQLSNGSQVAFYYGKTRPPILGAALRSLTDEEKSRLKLSGGVAIVAVEAGTPAQAARLERGDVIVAIDGKPVADPAALAALLHQAAGRAVEMGIVRGGAPMTVAVKLNPAR